MTRFVGMILGVFLLFQVSGCVDSVWSAEPVSEDVALLKLFIEDRKLDYEIETLRKHFADLQARKAETQKRIEELLKKKDKPNG